MRAVRPANTKSITIADSAAGTHGDCPDRYRNRAYVNNDLWDIHALGDCKAGTHCPVSPTFTDEQFEVSFFPSSAFSRTNTSD